MFIAHDTIRGTVVSGPEVNQQDPETNEVAGSRFECVDCELPLRYTGDSGDEYFEYFTHKGPSCVKDGNMSVYHRLAEEAITKEVINWLPGSVKSIKLDIEGRIGTASDFVIADICLRHPTQLAVEVVYSNTDIRLHRRLRTLFRAGYAVTFVVVQRPEVSVEEVDAQLAELGEFRVGEFDPETQQLEFGTIICPEEILQMVPRSQKNSPRFAEGLRM